MEKDEREAAAASTSGSAQLRKVLDTYNIHWIIDEQLPDLEAFTDDSVPSASGSFGSRSVGGRITWNFATHRLYIKSWIVIDSDADVVWR
jgi:hypothetical protein